MSKEFKRTERSNILIHWTGKDIDAQDQKFSKTLPVNWRKYCLRPIEQPSLIEEPTLIKAYVNRLRDILKFGLWVTNDKSIDDIGKESSCSKDDGRVYETPNVARVCFTELKLSESRKHAFEFGRLGIGMKKMFLVKRGGQPMIYIADKKGHKEPNWFLSEESHEVQNCFFKFMSETEDLNYKYYSESEWRIAYPNKASVKHPTVKAIKKYVININGNLDKEVKKYKDINRVNVSKAELDSFIKQNKEKGFRFLVPLNFWLAIIIYPCPAVKIAAEQDDEIRNLMRCTRRQGIDRFSNLLLAQEKDSLLKELGQLGVSKGVGEYYMMPMEIDLDTISHF